MKKRFVVLIVTLLLVLCSCTPTPNGKQIFAIKDPQQITLYDDLLISNSFQPSDFAAVELTQAEDIAGICNLLNGLTLTEVAPGGVLGGISIHITEEKTTHIIRVAGIGIYCEWNGKAYQADEDITEELRKYLTRDVGTVSNGKNLFQTDKITRITVTNSQWEEIEMTDIAPAVTSLAELTLTRANTSRLEGGLHATLYLQDGSSIGITFGGNLMQINNKMYQVDHNVSDVSDLFGTVIHP